MAKTNLRHYRQITRTVLRYYAELEDGYISLEDERRFDSRFLDYRIDVDNVLKKFHPSEVKIALLVNRDGLSHAQALTAAKVEAKRPDLYVEDIEIRLGQAFERHRLDDFLKYVDYLR